MDALGAPYPADWWISLHGQSPDWPYWSESVNTPYTTTRSDWSFAATLLAIAAGLCLLPFAARAEGPAGLPMLLAAPAADSVRAAEKARPAERGVARQRPVAVAFEHLDPPSGNVPARIGVELFDGMIVVVDFVRIDRRGPNNYTWHGRVDGYDKSEAVLTVVDGNIAGTISLVDSAARIAATYQLQTNRDGTQSLRQIEQSGFPTDHPPGSEKLRAPVPEKAAPRSSRGDIELKGGAIAAADTGAIIDVMVVYSKQTAAAAGTAIGAQIQQAIDSANAAYANSGITTRLNLVHTAAVNYDESGDFNTDLNRLTSGSDGYMDEVAALRNTHGADLVSLFVENGQYCGIAWVGPSASYGFSVINRGCASGNLSFAHELGHNFGALHDPYVDPGTSPYAYGHGYAVPAAGWRTVMAYNNACSAAGTSCTRIPYFSNPNLTYGSPAQAAGHRRDLRQRAGAQPERRHGGQLPHLGHQQLHVRLLAGQRQCRRHRHQRLDQRDGGHRLRLDHDQQRELARRRIELRHQRHRHPQLHGRRQYRPGAQRHDHGGRGQLHRQPGERLHLHAERQQRELRGERRQRQRQPHHRCRLHLDGEQQRDVADRLVREERQRVGDGELRRRRQYQHLDADRQPGHRRQDVRRDRGGGRRDRACCSGADRQAERDVGQFRQSEGRHDQRRQDGDTDQYRRWHADDRVAHCGWLQPGRLRP